MAGGRHQPAVTGLPIEDVVDEVRAALAGPGVAVLQAEPGAGKTTVVPLRLLGERWLGAGRIILLEPRRVAARAAARRMAQLLGEPVGGTVGYATRDDRRVGPGTVIEVVTEGILTRRVQRDPALPGVGAVIFDEWHERHLAADVGLALVLDARNGLREDLRVLVMSATLDPGPLSALLGGAPVVTSRGRTHPVTVRWVPGPASAGLGADDRVAVRTASAIRAAIGRDPGDVLAFLPGTGEIRATAAALGRLEGVDVLALHGNLPAAEQDRALQAGPRRRVVLATDVAESSVTVEGVGVVVDAGLARRPSTDPSTGLARLRTVTASRASADQRAGRAGRLGPGVAYRLWTEAGHGARRAWPTPEIVTADLADVALELAVWGAPADALSWLDPPPGAALAGAAELLGTLGAVVDGRPTPRGRAMVELPVHPRLAAMLVSAAPDERRRACTLAALVTERDILRRDGPLRPTADVAVRLSLLEAGGGRGGSATEAVASVRRRASELARRLPPVGRHPGGAAEAADAGALLAAAYPDRLAQWRGGARYLLRHGGGATLADDDPLVGAPWLVVADVDAGGGGAKVDGTIRLAATLERAEVERAGAGGLQRSTHLTWDGGADDLREVTETTLGALVLDTTVTAARPGPATAAALVARAAARDLADLRWTAATRALQRRAVWVQTTLGDPWPDVSDAALVATANEWLAPLLLNGRGRADIARVDPGAVLGAALGAGRRELDRVAPPVLALPSGRRVAVDYADGQPRVAVRVQDLYGLSTHPTVGGRGRQVPVIVELLSPAGRPVQVTSDLPGFWAGSWAQVRREMAGRYPRHPWPTDPATAAPPRRRGS